MINLMPFEPLLNLYPDRTLGLGRVGCGDSIGLYVFPRFESELLQGPLPKHSFVVFLDGSCRTRVHKTACVVSGILFVEEGFLM